MQAPHDPISRTSRGRDANTELRAGSPVLDAIHRRRGRLGFRTLLSVAWRLVIVAALSVPLEIDRAADLLRIASDDGWSSLDVVERVKLASLAWYVPASLAYVCMPAVRALRSRPRPVPPVRVYSTRPSLGTVLVTTWWVPVVFGLGYESRSNNSGGVEGILWLDVLLLLVAVIGWLILRGSSRIEVSEQGLRIRVPDNVFGSNELPDRDVTPTDWGEKGFALIWPLVGFAIWLMAFTLGAHLAIGPIVILWLIAVRWWYRASQERTAAWEQLRLVARDGGTQPAVQLTDGVLSLRPFLRGTSRNESLPWTIAQLDRDRAGRAEEVTGPADAELRALFRQVLADSPRPVAGPAVDLGIDGGHAMRSRFRGAGSIALGIAVTAFWAWRAIDGDPVGILVVLGVVGILGTLLAVTAARSRRVRVRADAGGISVRRIIGMRSWPSSELGALIPLAVMIEPGRGMPVPQLEAILIDRQGRPLHRFRGADWTTEQLDSIAVAAGIPMVPLDLAVPVRTMSLAFPGYAPIWERNPAVFGFAIAGVIVVGIVAYIGVTQGFESDIPETPPSAEYLAERRERDALRRDLETLVDDTFPNGRGDGDPAGCVDEAAAPAAQLAQCRVSPALRVLATRLGRGDPVTAMSVLCRCRPSEFGSSYFSGDRDPTAEPGSYEELTPSRDAPRIVVEVTSINDGAILLDVDMDLDPATGRRTITDVRCQGDPDAPGLRAIASAAGVAAPRSAAMLGCPPEDD